MRAGRAHELPEAVAKRVKRFVDPHRRAVVGKEGGMVHVKDGKKYGVETADAGSTDNFRTKSWVNPYLRVSPDPLVLFEVGDGPSAGAANPEVFERVEIAPLLADAG